MLLEKENEGEEEKFEPPSEEVKGLLEEADEAFEGSEYLSVIEICDEILVSC